MGGESQEGTPPFLVRYTDSKRQGRLFFIAIAGALASVGVLAGWHFATTDGSADVGWLFPSLIVLLPPAIVVYALAVHGSVLGELQLHDWGLEFIPSGSASTNREPIAYSWELFTGWRLLGDPDRAGVQLHVGGERKVITLQAARFDAEESRRFQERWEALAERAKLPPQPPAAASHGKRVAGWIFLLLFVTMALVLILSGEMDRDSWIRLALLCPAVLPAIIRLMQARKTG